METNNKETGLTLGEKLKSARKSAGLTQEQLSEKLMVSRQAVTKWESNKGMPDIQNLKALSQLLNVSVDYLLDNTGESISELVMREAYSLDKYEKGSKKTKKDHIVQEKFPNSEIYTLYGVMKLTKSEKLLGNTLGLLGDTPFGIPEFINSIKNLDKEFYLVNKDDKQFLVTITDEFIETRQLAKHITDKKFEIGNWEFKKLGLVKVKDKKDNKRK